MLMKTGISILVGSALALAACSEDAPPPAPKPAAKAPAAAPAPAPVQVPPDAPKAAEAPKPSPDQALAARVKEALEGEAKIQAAAIDVTASGGKVTLWGTAAAEDERERAASVARKVEGVSAVDNQIKVVRGS
jgi:hypothetical protein